MKERKFIVTSPKFDGSIVFKYALNGFLKLFKIDADITQGQHRGVLKRVPAHISQIKKLNSLGDVEVEEVPTDLSFDNFWKTYANFAGKKVACRKMWEKLSEQDKTQALNGISIYKQRKASDKTAIAYPDTYLRNRIWE